MLHDAHGWLARCLPISMLRNTQAPCHNSFAMRDTQGKVALRACFELPPTLRCAMHNGAGPALDVQSFSICVLGYPKSASVELGCSNSHIPPT